MENLLFTSESREQINYIFSSNVHLLSRVEVLRKCRNKFDDLVYEMLFITALKPNLNVQSDYIRAKVFS